MARVLNFPNVGTLGQLNLSLSLSLSLFLSLSLSLQEKQTKTRHHRFVFNCPTVELFDLCANDRDSPSDNVNQWDKVGHYRTTVAVSYTHLTLPTS